MNRSLADLVKEVFVSGLRYDAVEECLILNGEVAVVVDKEIVVSLQSLLHYYSQRTY
jgi:hypothetical protein